MHSTGQGLDPCAQQAGRQPHPAITSSWEPVHWFFTATSGPWVPRSAVQRPCISGSLGNWKWVMVFPTSINYNYRSIHCIPGREWSVASAYQGRGLRPYCQDGRPLLTTGTQVMPHSLGGCCLAVLVQGLAWFPPAPAEVHRIIILLVRRQTQNHPRAGLEGQASLTPARRRKTCPAKPAERGCSGPQQFQEGSP